MKPKRLGHLNKEILSDHQRDIGEVERMQEALIKSLENKLLNPEILEPFLAANWEKNFKN